MDKISSVQTLYGLPGSWEAFADLIVYADDVNLVSRDVRVQNLAKEEISTLDVNVGFDFETSAGYFATDLTWSQAMDFTLFLDTYGFTDPIDLVGIRVPKNSGMLSVQWNKDEWFASLNSIYRGDRDSSGILTTAGDYSHYDSSLLHNLRLGRSFSSGFLSDSQIALRVTNVTEEKTMAQRFDNLLPVGDKIVTGSVSDPRGRMIFLDISKTF